MLEDFIKEPFLGFDRKSVDFLNKLRNKRYNNKTWFDANRDTYETHLKHPMRTLIDTLASELKKVDDTFFITYKSILRINRDIRFKADKTPYKTNYAAAFTYERQKTPDIPQYYFELSYNEFLFAAGQYSMEPDALKKIRRGIYGKYDEFNEIINDRKFRKNYGNVLGISLQKLPKEFSGKYLSPELEKFLKMKQFYVYRTFEPDVAFSPYLVDLIIEEVKTTHDFTKFLFKTI
ncbi:MAG: DUF2461 domain-containing protein [Bacteroidetes bacterium]|nr:DUF2461 domain-containing protein [Bacteroidota bacterium]